LTQAQELINAGVQAQVNFNYDPANRLTGVTDSIAGGTPTINRAFNYDIADRLTQITDSTSSSVSLANYTYGYDNANRVTSTTAPEGNSTFTYDDRNQLTGVSGWHNESYGYDPNGNRNTNGNTPGAGNRQQSDGTFNYVYDNEGNVLTQTRIADQWTWTYTWDYRNRLTEVVVKNNLQQIQYDDKFVYDANDQRIGKSVNGTWTWTSYDGANAFADFNGSGALQYHYLYGLGMDSILARVDASNNTAFYLADKLGSVRMVVNVGGTVLDQLAYDSFGKIVNETNPFDRFKYTAREYDVETGDYYYRRRYYNPTAGRFLSEDPSGLGPDINPYRYVGNDPTNGTDPSGMETIPLIPWEECGLKVVEIVHALHVLHVTIPIVRDKVLIEQINWAFGSDNEHPTSPCKGTIKALPGTLSVTLDEDFEGALDKVRTMLKDKGYTVLQTDVYAEIAWAFFQPTKNPRAGKIMYTIRLQVEFIIQKGKTKSRVRMLLGEPHAGELYDPKWETRELDTRQIDVDWHK
jgi:RHS repeat-associated protein